MKKTKYSLEEKIAYLESVKSRIPGDPMISMVKKVFSDRDYDYDVFKFNGPFSGDFLYE